MEDGVKLKNAQSTHQPVEVVERCWGRVVNAYIVDS